MEWIIEGLNFFIAFRADALRRRPSWYSYISITGSFRASTKIIERRFNTSACNSNGMLSKYLSTFLKSPLRVVRMQISQRGSDWRRWDSSLRIVEVTPSITQ